MVVPRAGHLKLSWYHRSEVSRYAACRQLRGLGPDWRNKYATFAVGWYLDSLRSVLLELNAYSWAEIVVGSSWRGYRVLDFYIRMMSSGIPARIEEAWYLLQATVPLQYRRMVWPEDWWRCHCFLSIGQRESIADWYVAAAGGGQTMHPRHARRIGIMQGHVVPPGIAVPDTIMNTVPYELRQGMQMARLRSTLHNRPHVAHRRPYAV